MDLTAHTRTIYDLFSIDKKYIVPRFQREYSWEKDQINELWNDITSNILLNENNEFDNEEYFIGSLVLIGNDKSTSFLIVDGQQRLTTVTLLLSALVQRFKDISQKNLANGLFKFIEGTDVSARPFFKLENENPKPFLQKSIQYIDKEKMQPSTPEEERLFDAYKRLYGHLSEEDVTKSINNYKNSNYPENERYLRALEAIRTQILSNLKVIYITVANEDDAYMIFETLNARGINLSTVDLIKNEIFKTLRRIHPNDDAKTKWKKIRTNLSSREEIIDINTFFRHFWLSNYGFTTEEKMYKKFKQYIAQNEFSVPSFLDSLVKEAEYYNLVSNPLSLDWKMQEEKTIYNSLTAINLFRIKIVRPLLIALIAQRNDKKIHLSDLQRVLNAMENFHFLHSAICSSKSTGIESKYSKTARLIRECDNKNETKLQIDELITYWTNKIPTETFFKERFKKLTFSKDKKLIQYIFKKWEGYLIQTNELELFQFTLEHLAPQSGSVSNVHQIGNLLPISGKINNELGTNSFSDKLVVLQKSEIKVVSDFLSSYSTKTSWTEADISQRTLGIADIAFNKIWKIE